MLQFNDERVTKTFCGGRIKMACTGYVEVDADSSEMLVKIGAGGRTWLEVVINVVVAIAS